MRCCLNVGWLNGLNSIGCGCPCGGGGIGIWLPEGGSKCSLLPVPVVVPWSCIKRRKSGSLKSCASNAWWMNGLDQIGSGCPGCGGGGIWPLSGGSKCSFEPVVLLPWPWLGPPKSPGVNGKWWWRPGLLASCANASRMNWSNSNGGGCPCARDGIWPSGGVHKCSLEPVGLLLLSSRFYETFNMKNKIEK
jgi:hypothetical protein